MPDLTESNEIRDAAEVLLPEATPNRALLWWLIDTVLLHTPTGAVCGRDGDHWPCQDVTAAHRVAATILEGVAR